MRLAKGAMLEGFSVKDETLVSEAISSRGIQVEIGDSKTPEALLPQSKIMLWGNEVNLSVRDLMTGIDATAHIEDGKVIHRSPKIEFHQYEKPEAGEDGGLELEWVLIEPPESNVLTASIRTKGLEFHYQPHEIDLEGWTDVVRPENVKGSYAVYHDSKMHNQYKTGKAFHIYRPKATDAKGNETWCELFIDVAAELLTVTVPQKFLESAVYPVVVDPTFGYTSIGVNSATTASSNLCRALIYAGARYTAGAGESITSYWEYGRKTGAGFVAMSAYNYTGGVPVTRIAPEVVFGSMTSTIQWWSEPASDALTNGVEYVVAFNPRLGTSAFWDTVASSDSRATSTGLPATWTQTSITSDRYSMYADTTPVGHISSMAGFGGGLVGNSRGLAG